MIEIVEKLIAKSKELKATPVIMYSREILISNLMKIVREVNAVKDNKVIPLYSVKACRNKEVIKEISNFVKGFSVSSDSEYFEVRNFKSSVISATGYNFVERTDISENNIIFYFTSLRQLKIFLDKKKICSNIKIGIRMKGPKALYFKNGKDSRFGLSLNELDDLYALQKKYNFKVISILIHQENKVLYDYRTLKTYLKVILIHDSFKKIKSINLGGGWDNLFLKNQISEFINRLKIPKKYLIYIEPGSTVVRTIGLLKAKVIDESIDEGKRKIVLNTSQFNNSSWFVPRIIGSAHLNSNNEILDTYVYGNTCYENDYFGKYSDSNITFGDEVFMYPVGAYYETTHRELHGIKFPKEYYL